MAAEPNIQSFIEEQKRLLRLELEHFTNNPQDCEGIDHGVALEEGRYHIEQPQTIAACDKATTNRVGLSGDRNERESNDKNDPLVETLPLCCDGRCLEKKKQSFLVQSEKPLTFNRSNASHTPPAALAIVATIAQGAHALGSDSGHVRMLRRCAGEYSPNHPSHRARISAPYLGLGEYDPQQYQQQQRHDLNLNLNNINKPKHNRHVHYVNSNVDATISTTAACKSNLNQIQQDNATYLDLPLSPTTAINNNPRRATITNKSPSNQRNIHLNINNNFTDDQQQQSSFRRDDDSSEYDLTDVDVDVDVANTNGDSSASDQSPHGDCACAPNDAVMHHNSRSPILHRLDRNSGVSTSIGTTSRLTHMDKPRSILSNRYYTSNISPRDRLLSDLKHTYVPSVTDGFSFTERTEEYERERVKKELYQNELRLQIEEKRRQATMRENQERVEQELENRRLEQQLLRMHEEELRDEERRTLRRNSEDLQRRAQEIGTRATYPRSRHTDSESNLHKMPSPYSPPMARRHNMAAPSSSVFDTSPVTHPNRYNAQALRNRMDSLSDSYGTYNTYGGGRSTIDGAGVFNRYDSLSRIDALKQQHTALNRLDSLTLNDTYSNRIQRRHSSTHQDLSSSRRSPKLQRRSSSSRFDNDTLPIPLLKAASHSPVARDLRNATAVNSNKYSVSESLRRLEEKWQIPAVQKNIMSYDLYPDGHNRGILTQLGSMRMQLQQEQLRMDEALRRRGYSSQYKAVNFH